jgi:branched-chain amino acid transport system substrate-binding protein
MHLPLASRQRLWRPLARLVLVSVLGLYAFAAQAERLVVAHVAPFSGLEATRGRAYAAGLALAFNPVNKAGGVAGHTLALVSADDHNRAEDTVAELRRLLAEQKPLLLTGLVGDESVSAVLRSGLLEAEKLPVLGLRTLALDVEHPQIFPLQAGTRAELTKIVEQLATVGLKRIGLFQEEGAKLVAQTLQAGVAKVPGMAITVQTSYPAGTARATAAAERMLGSDVQAIVMVASSSAAAAFIETYRTGGGTAQLFAHSGADIEQLAKRLAEQHTQGLAIAQVVPNPYKIHLRLTREFNEAYRAAQAAGAEGTSGLPVSYSMMEGYIAGRVLVEAVRKLGPHPTRENLSAALESLGSLDLGGLRLNFAPGARAGSKLVELSIVTPEGKIRQ